MQTKYKPKKGRRFNHNNITYEISRPVIEGNQVQFEISSKIPEDELEDSKGATYFGEIKKAMDKGKVRPVSVEMENIVWESKKDNEKERDYVKLLYQYPLDDLFDNKEVEKRFANLSKSDEEEILQDTGNTFTPKGKLVLILVREKIQELAGKHIEDLIEANKDVREKLKK